MLSRHLCPFPRTATASCDVLPSKGSLTASIVHPRNAYVPVIRHSAAAVIFVHNHPSGDPTPSREDLDITRRLREVGYLIGVRWTVVICPLSFLGRSARLPFNDRLVGCTSVATSGAV